MRRVAVMALIIMSLVFVGLGTASAIPIHPSTSSTSPGQHVQLVNLADQSNANDPPGKTLEERSKDMLRATKEGVVAESPKQSYDPKVMPPGYAGYSWSECRSAVPSSGGEKFKNRYAYCSVNPFAFRYVKCDSESNCVQYGE